MTNEAKALEAVRESMPDAVTFDWAIPLEQFKLLCDAAGFNVSGRIVTAYGPTGAFGMIVGLDDEAREIVARTLPSPLA